MAIFSLTCLIVASGPARAADEKSRTENVYKVALETYIFAYPLILMDLSRQRSTNVATAMDYVAPMNQFAHMKSFPKPDDQLTVHGNVDTLYSLAFLDLSNEPIVLHVPDTAGRYYMMPMLDAWTNVFVSLGKRTTGTKAGDFAIVGPHWQGEVPRGVKSVKAPTNNVLIAGRTQVNNKADMPAVHAIQKQYTLTPLSAFGSPYTPPAKVPTDPDLDMTAPVAKQIDNMDAATYFQTFANLMISNPPAAADEKIVKSFAILGIVPGKPLDVSTWDAATKSVVERAVKAAVKKRRTQPEDPSKQFENFWLIKRSGVGTYGTDYHLRAYTGMIALGAGLPQDAIYPMTQMDSKGRLLSGENHYVIHFDKGQTPPVHGFWSLSMYDQDRLFVSNPISRFAIGDRQNLKFNEDGSLDIYLQHDSPGRDKAANWLPAPKRKFNLIMRIYWPKKSLLDGTWKMPPIERVD
jgi:hypothetical protein